MLSDSVWNHTRDNKSESRCSDIRFCSVTPMSTDRIRLHAVLLPLIITTVLLLLFVCLFVFFCCLVGFILDCENSESQSNFNHASKYNPWEKLKY